MIYWNSLEFFTEAVFYNYNFVLFYVTVSLMFLVLVVCQMNSTTSFHDPPMAFLKELLSVVTGINIFHIYLSFRIPFHSLIYCTMSWDDFCTKMKHQLKERYFETWSRILSIKVKFEWFVWFACMQLWWWWIIFFSSVMC